MSPNEFGVGCPRSSITITASLCAWATSSNEFAVDFQFRRYESSPGAVATFPQTDAATCRAVVFPLLERPRKWNPPPSIPTTRIRGAAKATDAAKTRRLLPEHNLPTFLFQLPCVPNPMFGSPENTTSSGPNEE